MIYSILTLSNRLVDWTCLARLHLQQLPQRWRPGTSSRRSSARLACPTQIRVTRLVSATRPYVGVSSGQPCTAGAALGISLIFGSPYTNSRTERVNHVIAGVLRSFVDGRHDDWPSLIPLMEFAINDSASPSATVTRPQASTRTRGQRAQRPLLAPGPSLDDLGLGGDALARHLAVVSDEVRGLMHKSQAARKARLDPTPRDVRFKPLYNILLDTTFITAAVARYQVFEIMSCV